jgi:glycosyltransferase involved in cell wall biosynthesis
MHDFYRKNYPGAMSWMELAYFSTCLKSAMGYSDAIFTNSEFSKRELERIAARANLRLPEVVVAGIGFTRLTEGPSEKRNKLILLTSAWPHKLTLQAVDYVESWQRDTGFSGEVQLVGSLPRRLVLPEFKNWHHRRRLSEDEYRKSLAEARALLFFSRYEGFGMPPVEAAIAGACPVYSDLDVTREVMMGKGYSFSNGSYDSFVSAMEKAFKISSEQVEEWGKELLSRHNWDKVTERIADGLLHAAPRGY